MWWFLITSVATLAVNFLVYFTRAEVLELLMEIVNWPAYLVLKYLLSVVGSLLLMRLQPPFSYIILFFLFPAVVNGMIGGTIGFILASVKDLHAFLKLVKDHLKLPRYKYFLTTMRWFLVASVGTIPLVLLGHYLPKELWGLIRTIFFWPANLLMFLLGPFNI